MTPFSFTLYTFGLSLLAGLLGSLLGLGGGIIVVPGLTLLLHIDIKYAIGASIVSVIATSSGSAASYVKEHMSNIRLSMVLEMATTLGALSGAYLTGILPVKWLYIIFALVMGYAAIEMLRNSKKREKKALPSDHWADKLKLHGEYFDQAENRQVEYRVSRTKLGLIFSYFAGIISGLLGIGGGAMKVPTMNLAMGLPIKVATATSNFMIGVTAAASAPASISCAGTSTPSSPLPLPPACSSVPPAAPGSSAEFTAPISASHSSPSSSTSAGKCSERGWRNMPRT
jgi:uncharacterized membrane protein YfcA